MAPDRLSGAAAEKSRVEREILFLTVRTSPMRVSNSVWPVRLTQLPPRGPQPIRRWTPVLALVPLMGAAMVSCSDSVAVTRGVGAIVQEQRTLRPIQSVEVNGGIDLTIHVRGDGDQGRLPIATKRDTLVWIDAPEDLIPLVIVEPRGSVLRVGPKDGVRLDPIPTVEVYTDRLVSVVADGAGDVRVTMDLLEGGTIPELSLLSRGAVDFHGEGRLGRLVVDQSGSGDMHLENLAASVAEIHSSGSGDVWADVSGRVRVRLTGACDLFLTGTAVVEELEILGSGKVHRSAEAPGLR